MTFPLWFRRLGALLLLVCGLPVSLLTAQDECISDPAEGIFCSDDENTAYESYIIYGHETATWTASTLTAGVTYYYSIQGGASLRVTGDATDYYRAKTMVSGSGEFHLVAGYLRILSLGALFGQHLYVTDSHLASGLYGSAGANFYSDATLHLTDATLRLERGYDYANTLANPFALAGQARLEVVSPSGNSPGDVAVTATNVISGTGTLVQAGPGLLRLTGTNTYSGGTRIDGGNIEVWSDANLGAADTALAFAADAGLWLNDGFASSARATTLTAGLGYIGVRSGAATWHGLISGDGGLVKSGTGTLTLTGANTYAGGTTVSAGTLAVSADAHLGAADTALTLANGTTLTATSGFTASARLLTFSGTSATVETATGTLTWNGATAGSGQLLKTGSGTLVLAGGIGHTGGAVISAGTVEVNVSATLGDTGTTTWSGPISGTGAFAKSGAGTLELSGAATLSGGTFLRAGTLRTTAANVLSATSAHFLIGGATLDLAGHDQTVGDLDSYNHATGAVEASTVDLGGATLTNLNRVTNLWAGDLTGTGTLVKQGAAEMKWYAANTFTGTLRVDTGTVSAQADDVFSPHAVIQLASGTTLRLNDHAQTAAGLAGSGTVALGSAALTLAPTADTAFSGAITGTGSVVKSGAATLTLSGANTFSGGLTLAGGTLRTATDAALGHSSGILNFDGGTLELTADLTSARDVTLASSGTIATDAAVNLSGLLSGSGSLAKSGSGTLTLSHANTFSGGMTVAAGTLAAAHDEAFGTGAIAITGGTLDLGGRAVANAIAHRGGTVTGLSAYTGTQTIFASTDFNGQQVGGSVVVADTATLDTTSATFTGAITLQSGSRLAGSGSLAAVTVQSGARLTGTPTLAALTLESGAILAPGNSPGTLTVTGDAALAAGAHLELELNATTGTAGTNWDRLVFDGTLDLTGLSASSPFIVDLISLTPGNTAGALDGWTPATDYTWEFAVAAGGIAGFSPEGFTVNLAAFSSTNSVTGTFAVTSSTTSGGTALNLVYTAPSAVPEPSTYALLSSGLVLAAALLRRRRTA